MTFRIIHTLTAITASVAISSIAPDNPPQLQNIDFVHHVSDQSRIRTIGFGSCHKRKRINPRIWQSIRYNASNETTRLRPPPAHGPVDAWIWTGDAVYPPFRRTASVSQLEFEFLQLMRNETIGYAGWAPPLGIYGVSMRNQN
jgi:hypothetical protein